MEINLSSKSTSCCHHSKWDERVKAQNPLPPWVFHSIWCPLDKASQYWGHGGCYPLPQKKVASNLICLVVPPTPAPHKSKMQRWSFIFIPNKKRKRAPLLTLHSGNPNWHGVGDNDQENNLFSAFMIKSASSWSSPWCASIKCTPNCFHVKGTFNCIT